MHRGKNRQKLLRSPVRVAHLVSHPIQYYTPLYRELSKRREIDLTVYFYSDFSIRGFHNKDFGAKINWDVPLLGGYKHRLCASAVGRQAGATWRPNWDLLKEVICGDYDVIWSMSYANANAVLLRLAARALGIPVIFRDDTTLLTPRPVWKSALKQVALRLFLRKSWALYVGKENRQYWQSYGIPEKRLFFAPHCVDNAFWETKAKELAPRKRDIRQQFGITDDAPVVLFCGKLIEKKQPLLLLEAYKRVRRQASCWLMMAGDGPLRFEIEKRASKENIPGVLLPGFLNQSELPMAYAAADVLVLPSSFNETWGLVVNEAMSFSLPIVVSDSVGCAPDLVKSGENGFIFRNNNVDSLAIALLALVEKEAMRHDYGQRSGEIVRDYCIEAAASGVVNACLAAAREM